MSEECRIISSDAPEVVSFKADDDLKPGKVEWANYVKVSGANAEDEDVKNMTPLDEHVPR